MFCYKNFIVLDLTLRSLLSFELTLGKGVKRDPSSSLVRPHSVFPDPLVEETAPSSSHGLGSPPEVFDRTEKALFRALYPIPSIRGMVFKPAAQCFRNS